MNRSCLVLALSAAACMNVAEGAPAAVAQTRVPVRQHAIVSRGPGPPQLESIPVRQPGPGQVLIRVYAAAINSPARSPAERTSSGNVPGQDVSGVIVAIGEGVTERRPGMRVFGIVDRVGLNGAYAQYTVANVSSTALKPRDLSFAQAAGLGVAGVTALRVIDEGQVHAGKRVLILGVAGGVGSLVAQIAVARGATVLGTASPRHGAYLRSIGVSRVINYAAGDVAARAGRVDVVIDTVGGHEALEALAALGPGGRFVSIARARVPPEQCAARRLTCLGSPGPAARAPASVIQEVANLAADGELRVHVDRSYPLARAAEALRYVDRGHTEGKVILAVTREANAR